MTFISQYLQYTSCVPRCVAFLCLPSEFGQRICDILTRITVQIHKEYESHCLCFFLIYSKLTVLIVVISKQNGSQNNTTPKTHFNGRIHNGAFNMGLLLSDCCSKTQTHFGIIIQGKNALCFKPDSYGIFQRRKLTDDTYAINNVSCKTRNTLCDYHINFSGFAILYHTIKRFSM